MLEVKNIKKEFNQKLVVNDVSFSVNSGEILGLLGKNGAGKSTIFRLILNIIDPEEGQILLNGKKYTIKDTKLVGFLPEEGSLGQELTVYEQMCFYGSLKGISEEQVLERLEYWLQKFDIVEYMNKRIKELSKGNRQRIQFIAAIMHDPDLIILDEPFSGLDPLGVEKFKEILIELKHKNKAIIFSSHRMEHVELFCDNILMIDKGNTILKGSLNEIKKSYPKEKVIYDGNESYVLKEEVQEYVEKLKNKNIQDIKVEKLSLNDIFIDKVGDVDVK